MSAAWFYNHRGRLQGPFEAKIIIEKIKARELGPDDLVYQEGEDKWFPLSSFPKFAKEIPKETEEEAQKLQGDRPWVVLERNKDKANRQLGPYSTEEMRGMLARGELQFSDYVWRSGMKEWYRVQVFKELVDEVSSKEAGATPPTVPKDLPAEPSESTHTSAQDGEGKVYEITYQEVTASMPMPEEAEGPDLAKTKKDPRDEKLVETRVNYKLGPDAIKNIRKTVHSGSAGMEFVKDLITGQAGRWMATGVGILLVIFLARGAWNRAGEIMSSADEPAVEAVVEEKKKAPVRRRAQPKKQAVTKVVAATPEPPKPTAEPKKPATRLKLVHNKKSGKLSASTDASSHFATSFIFSSLFGKVVGRNSYHRVLLRKNREIDLRELNWPRGYYSVEAKMGELTSRATVFVGSGKSYTKDLRKFKKQMTFEFMNERVAFIKVSTELLEKARMFGAILKNSKSAQAWRRDYRPWRRAFGKVNHRTLRNIGPKSRNRYVMAEMWLELKAARKEMDKITRGMSNKSKRSSSSQRYEFQKVRRQIASLVDQAQGLSLWR